MEVDVHVVSGRYNRLQNPIRLVSGLHLQVENIAFNGLASSLATLSTEQKELGTLVIDLGAGTTDYAIYSGGVIKHTGVLAVGGDHVSNDLWFTSTAIVKCKYIIRNDIGWLLDIFQNEYTCLFCQIHKKHC